MSTSKTPAAATAPRAMHEPFDWFSRNVKIDSSAQLAARTYDVMEGIALILDMLKSHDMNQCAKQDTALSDQAIERLHLLAIQSARMLSAEAWQEIELINNAADQKAQA